MAIRRTILAKSARPITQHLKDTITSFVLMTIECSKTPHNLADASGVSALGTSVIDDRGLSGTTKCFDHGISEKYLTPAMLTQKQVLLHSG